MLFWMDQFSSIDFAYVCEPPLKMQVAPLKNQ
ncbi:hypothetical protein GGD38_007092 [Chitinophagaceae bacterium OAS944]|nr:hypothetical protein [Chitinophagaceae bacterium OAS944]